MSYSFWGPNMNACLEWATSRGWAVGPMAPIQFANAMDVITGVAHIPNESPEDAATRWLGAIEYAESAESGHA